MKRVKMKEKSLLVDAPSHDDTVMFMELTDVLFSRKKDVARDTMDADKYIKNCLFIRRSLEKSLKNAEISGDDLSQNKIRNALDKNRLNYCYFTMLKKSCRNRD